MRIRLLRAFFTLTTLAVVWFVASPAFASSAPVSLHAPAERSVSPSSGAPLCDPRGATTFAPPPQMQEVEVSLDSGLTLDDCMTTRSSDAGRASPGRAPVPLDTSASSDAALVPAVATLAAAARELQPVPVASTPCPRPGVRSTVDRPPRA